MATIEITAENFQKEVIESDKPVILDFWAVWCGPCRMVAPAFEELSQEHPEVKFGKVNTDEQMALAQQFRVSSIPYMCRIEGGQVVRQTVGAQSKEQLAATFGL